MIKLGQIISEIKITSKITPEMVIQLYNKIIWSSSRGEYDQPARLTFYKLLDEKFNIKNGNWHQDREEIEKLDKHKLSKLYIFCLEFMKKNNINEIKISSNITLKKILELMRDDFVYEYWNEVETIFYKYGWTYDTPGTPEMHLLNLSQQQLNGIYVDLLNFKNQIDK